MKRPLVALLALLAVAASARAQVPAVPPPKFSIDPTSPTRVGPPGITETDVLVPGPGPGPSILITGDKLGLDRDADFLRDFSFGNEAGFRIFFSVDRASVGQPNTPVNAEASANSAAADIFLFDPTLPSPPPHLLAAQETDIHLTDAAPQDNMTGLTFDSGPTLYFALDQTSAVVVAGGASAVNVYASDLDGSFRLFIDGVNDLGLDPDDKIDGLVLTPDHRRGLLSLTPDSPTVATGGGVGVASAADILFFNLDGIIGLSSKFLVLYRAPDIGLLDSDNIDALAVVPEPSSLLLLAVGGVVVLRAIRPRPVARLA